MFCATVYIAEFKSIEYLVNHAEYLAMHYSFIWNIFLSCVSVYVLSTLSSLVFQSCFD